MIKSVLVQELADSLGEEPKVVEAGSFLKPKVYVCLADDEKKYTVLSENSVYAFPDNDVVAVRTASSDLKDLQSDAKKFLKGLTKTAENKYADTTFYFIGQDWYSKKSFTVKLSLADIAAEKKARSEAKAHVPTIAHGAPGSEFSSATSAYTGKQLEAVVNEALPVVSKALRGDGWAKGERRHVKSVLAKVGGKELKELLKAAREMYDFYSRKRYQETSKSLDETYSEIAHLCHPLDMLRFGIDYVWDAFEATQELKKYDLPRDERDTVAALERYCRDLLPLARALAQIDNIVPAAKIVQVGELSAATRGMLVKHDLDPTTVRQPEIEITKKQVTVKVGGGFAKRTVSVSRILWPKDTIFGKAYLSKGSTTHSQCDACAHAIKDPFNWVPILIDDRKGRPHAMWVGHDCAKNLFGFEVEGDPIFDSSSASAKNVATVKDVAKLPEFGKDAEVVEVSSSDKPKSQVVDLADFIDWEAV